MKKLFDNKWVVLGSIIVTGIAELTLFNGAAFGLAIVYIVASMFYDLNK